MLNKTKDKKRKVTLFHIIFIVISLYAIFTFIKQEISIKKLNLEKAQSEEKLKQLNSQKKELEDKVKKTDSVEYIEKIAREELKMVKPNEMIYIDRNKHKEESFTD